MSSVSIGTRRVRAGMMMLAAIFVLAAAIIPACGSICCAREAAAAINAVMPCCETQPRLERSEPLRMPHATSVSIPAALAVPVTRFQAPPPRTLAVTAALRVHDPSPPLFLRNAQLLI